MTEQLPAGPSSPRRYRRRHIVVLAAALVVAVGVLLCVWPHQPRTQSYVGAQDKTTESLDAVMFAAIGRFPDPAVTHEDFNPCAGGQGLHSMNTHTTATGLTLNDATQAADKLTTFIRSKGYTEVRDDRNGVSVTVSGRKDGVTTTMTYDAGGLAFSATTGCNIRQ